MSQCTVECILTFFISHAPQFFTSRTIDYYVISSLMKGFRNILNILTTKPKFQPICTNVNFLKIIGW